MSPMSEPHFFQVENLHRLSGGFTSPAALCRAELDLFQFSC